MSKIRQNITQEQFKEFCESSYWYHTLDLGDGILTDGMYDLRPYLDLHEFPDSLEGKSVLDVGCSDGFYSFDFERRGADSVTSLDIAHFDGTPHVDPSPAKRQDYIDKYSRELDEYARYRQIFVMLGLKGAHKFRVLIDYFDSRVNFQNHSIYELEDLEKKFDFVFCGALMEHLKDPLKALEQLAAVTGETCVITLSGALPSAQIPYDSLRMKLARISLRLLGVRQAFSVTDRDEMLRYVGNQAGGTFYYIHPAAFKQMALASGFKNVRIGNAFDILDQRYGNLQHFVVFHCQV